MVCVQLDPRPREAAAGVGVRLRPGRFVVFVKERSGRFVFCVHFTAFRGFSSQVVVVGQYRHRASSSTRHRAEVKVKRCRVYFTSSYLLIPPPSAHVLAASAVVVVVEVGACWLFVRFIGSFVRLLQDI